jgi:hypothetical protein
MRAVAPVGFEVVSVIQETSPQAGIHGSEIMKYVLYFIISEIAKKIAAQT